MRIFLWGFMGAGKTTLGEQLANEFNYKFIDLDKYIETKKEQSIPEIFSQTGENYFRGLERRYLIELCEQNSSLILSCGGGTPCYLKNFKFMNNSGKTIYLKVTNDILLERLWKNKTHRPLIASMLSKEDLHYFIQNKIKEREAIYSTAKYIINNNDLNKSKEEIINLLSLNEKAR